MKMRGSLLHVEEARLAREYLMFDLVKFGPVVFHIQTKVCIEICMVLVRAFQDSQGCIAFVDIVQVDESLTTMATHSS